MARNEEFRRSNYNPCKIYFKIDNIKSYEIGNTNLVHNPILNPVVNLNYNKYLYNNLNPVTPQLDAVNSVNSFSAANISNPYDNNYHNQNNYYNKSVDSYMNQNPNEMSNYYQNGYGYNKPGNTPGEKLRMAANNILR